MLSNYMIYSSKGATGLHPSGDENRHHLIYDIFFLRERELLIYITQYLQSSLFIYYILFTFKSKFKFVKIYNADKSHN